MSVQFSSVQLRRSVRAFTVLAYTRDGWSTDRSYLHSRLNRLWYVSVPNLMPRRRPIGDSVSRFSENSILFRSFAVIQRNMALTQKKHNQN